LPIELPSGCDMSVIAATAPRSASRAIARQRSASATASSSSRRNTRVIAVVSSRSSPRSWQAMRNAAIGPSPTDPETYPSMSRRI
jgi:hypothetical protein